jgi:hypothetical protein
VASLDAARRSAMVIAAAFRAIDFGFAMIRFSGR